MLIHYNVLYSGLHYIHCRNTYFSQFNDSIPNSEVKETILQNLEFNHKIWKESVTIVYEVKQFCQNNSNLWRPKYTVWYGDEYGRRGQSTPKCAVGHLNAASAARAHAASRSARTILNI
jgi:hypothetical protein